MRYLSYVVSTSTMYGNIDPPIDWITIMIIDCEQQSHLAGVDPKLMAPSDTLRLRVLALYRNGEWSKLFY